MKYQEGGQAQKSGQCKTCGQHLPMEVVLQQNLPGVRSYKLKFELKGENWKEWLAIQQITDIDENTWLVKNLTTQEIIAMHKIPEPLSFTLTDHWEESDEELAPFNNG